MNIKKIIFSTAITLLPYFLISQNNWIQDIIFRIDTNVVSYKKDKIIYQNKEVVPLPYRINQEIVEITFIPNDIDYIKEIIPDVSNQYNIIEEPVKKENNTFEYSIQFINATKSNFIKHKILIINNKNDTIQILINLQPVSLQQIQIFPSQDDLYVGEEVSWELNTNIPENILPSSLWIEKDNYRYRIVEQNNNIYLQLIPFQAGKQQFNIDVQLYKPILNNNQFVFTFSFITPYFNVKPSRLAYLNISPTEFILQDIVNENSYEAQIDNNRALKLNKTYRIEDREDKGTLIAEIYTQKAISGNKILCNLNVYNIHSIDDGVLYIKDGDESKFITNFTVLPKTIFKSLSISQDGKTWSSQPNVKPGEKIIVSIEGQSLHKTNLSFKGLDKANIDTIFISSTKMEYRLDIPYNIYIPRIEILNYNNPTGFYLNVLEHQRPRDYDFVNIDYGEGFINVNEILTPIFYNKSIKNIVIKGDPSIIDNGLDLYGKQYLEIEIKIVGLRGEVIELTPWQDYTLCPDSNSIRYQFYNKNDCSTLELSLNEILNKKTYSLDPWTRIIITIRHKADKYPYHIPPKVIELICERSISFDIEVSFPAGLLTIVPNSSQISNLSGISMAMIAQFSFYQKHRYAKLLPMKLGFGFIALNAFNFSSQNINRDMSLVALVSLYPTTKDRKLNFPLYMGGGYFLSENEFFFLVGPGIQVSF
jgi:hypothetical protein